MKNSKKILAFSGSLRKDSFNKKLLEIAVKYCEKSNLQITKIDLIKYPLPLYNQDFEDKNGLPINALKLKTLFEEHSHILISSPEYNSSFSAVLKNTIDWISRPRSKKEEILLSLKGKKAALMSASPSSFGGIRGLNSLSQLLENLYIEVSPVQLSLPFADNAFDSDNKLKNREKFNEIINFIEYFNTKF